jgi:hypothetical protein
LFLFNICSTRSILAFAKALGTGIGRIVSFQDLTIRNNELNHTGVFGARKLCRIRLFRLRFFRLTLRPPLAGLSVFKI